MNLHQNDDHGTKSGENNGPVTVIVTRTAKREKIKEFEEWMDGVIHEAVKFEGHMGVNIIRPSDGALTPEYVIIFRFNTYDNLKKWENSEKRKEWIRKSRDVTEGDPRTEILSGLEFWFTPRSAGERSSVPPRYKMAMVTGGIVFVLLSTLIPQVRQLTTALPVFLSTLVGVVVMVILMTYVIMPSVTRLLRPWLSKERLF
jgi:antibiotic biosynthesis monooxygenase (ABM) superfamily enzyme